MRSILKTSLFVLLFPAFIHAEDIKEKYMDTALRIISEALADSTAYERLAYICDSCLLYTSPSPRDRQKSRMPSSA